MAKKGNGIFLVYTDIDPKHEEEFNAWYNTEHLGDLLRLPGFLDAEGKETTLFVRDIRARDVLSEITGNKHDPDPRDADESKFFSSAVRSVDHSTAMLRIIEGRVQVYRNAVAECQAALRELRASLSQAGQRSGKT